MGWLPKLSMLGHLDLSFVNISRATDWFSAINMFPSSFLVLKLHACKIPNIIPQHLPIINLTSLLSLDLASNVLLSFPLWIFNNSALELLSLASNYLMALFLHLLEV